jgi:tight adherence protein B
VKGSRPLQAGQVHLSENGAPVAGLSVSSLRKSGQGDFGVIVLFDTDPSMRGAPLTHAIAAARVLAAQRTGNQQLGIMFGDQTTLPLTSDPAAINRALATPPPTLSYTDLLRDATSAVSQLKSANIADGAVIYVSDDIDRDPTYTPKSVGMFAASAHVRIFVVGIHDAAFTKRLPADLPPSAMAELAASAGGQFTVAAPAQLTRIFSEIASGLTSRYVIRYRSDQPLGRNVAVSLRVDGLQGVFDTSYRSPAPVPPAKRTPRRPHPDQSFWASSSAEIFIVLGCAVLLGFAIALVMRHFATARELRWRVEDFVPSTSAPAIATAGQGAESVEDAPAALARTSWWPGFVENVGISRIEMAPIRLVQLAALVSAAAAVLLTMATNSVLVGVIGLAVGPLALRAFVNFHLQRQRALFSTQLPPHLEEVAGAMRSGRSLVEALAVVVDSAEEPTRGEFDRALADERLGRPLDETLTPIAHRMHSPDVEQLAVIAALHRGSGANVAEVLDHVAHAARERDEMRRELRTMTAQARLTRWILTLLPVAMLAGLTLLRPEYEHPLLHTSGGRLVLVFGALLVVCGSWVMSRIVDIEV